MNFFCVYVRTRKKLDKYLKLNNIKNKYIIDIAKIVSDEEVSFKDDKTYLKILIFNKIQQAIDRKKDIYYIPDFDNEFSIEKLLNLKKILGDNNFNVEYKCSYSGLLNHINLYSTVGYNSFTSEGENFKHHLNNFYWDFTAQVYYGKWTLNGFYVKPKKTLMAQIRCASIAVM